MSPNPNQPGGFTSDGGFGVIEIMVAMMLFAILCVAVLPVLVGALTNSSTNATLATATGIVQQEIERARSQTTCGALATPDSTATDSRGVDLTVRRTVDACPVAATDYPQAIRVRVDVFRADGGQVVASATTLVFVDGL